ncbi:TonB-linked outer membrane protein, SusC/RagA family [Mucilaginibacter pineti]|uniref:TonB-linked outer membrane protein, SusC/RagA family n=1 Tax=Mucilaginibacter pineti TaxID=1391627 RepID=A0A1G7II66_9SPHI|nr:SusC/RagA family TonB-linked outer membrane protein [Mucilaginibacter pineti]SDF11979.1 TonB-linked outer membrane protein, SusC/RagA family [Mucilaginibacter pineti]
MKINEKIVAGRPMALSKQIIRIMKLTILLMTVCLLQVSALTKAQVYLNTKGESLQRVLKSVSQQSGYDFVYITAELKGLKTGAISLKNASIDESLKACFADQPLVYEISDKTVMVRKKDEVSMIDKIIDRFQEITATGKVVDENGQALSGASVIVKATSKGTMTKADGTFAIDGVEEGAALLVKFLGYEPLEIPAGKSLGVIRLKLSENVLDQVIVRAYDKTSQRLSTGNISTVTAKQIQDQPVSNPLLALQGQVPGLIINQSSGYANSGVTVQIQGPNSLTNGNYPFYVVDGVPYPSTPMNSINSGLFGSTGNGGMGIGFNTRNGNPLAFLNPQDIESISILKDADATAIYGSQAANGAIIITTKRGRAGDAKIALNLQQGFAQNVKFLNLMGREQYLQMRRDAYFGTDGLTSSSPQFAAQYDLNGLWDTTRETDWQKVLLGGTASYTNLQGSLSGGTELDQYQLSLNYNRQTTVNPGDFSDQKAAFHFSQNHTGRNGRFKAQTTLSYLLDYNILPFGDRTALALNLSPVAPELYNSDGTFNWQTTASGASSWSNPMALLAVKAKTKTANLIGNLILSYQLASNLEVSASLGYSSMRQDEFRGLPFATITPQAVAAGVKPSATFANADDDSWIIEPKLSYNLVLGPGKFDAMAGSTLRRNNSKYQAFFGRDYVSDQTLENISSAGTVGVQSSALSEYRYGAVFGHLGYNVGDKYIVSLNGRRDGSSRFGNNNMFHNFWSAAGAWIFSQEHFLSDQLGWLSFGKLNLSYGSVGSDGINDYAFLSLYGASGSGPYQGVIIQEPVNLPNPNIQWEETRKFNAGLTIGLFRDRILLTADYYRNRSSNQLLSYTLPYITGFSSVPANFPATVQNKGWEFTMSLKPFSGGGLTWSSNFNIAFNRNKLVAFPDLATSSYSSSFVIGQPISAAQRAQYAGVNPQTGLYQFYRADGSLTDNPDYPSDYKYMDTAPKFTGGWFNTFSYRGFTLDVLFQFVYGNRQMNSLKIGSLFPGRLLNQPADLAYWRNPGDNASVQKVTVSNNDIQNLVYTALSSDFVWEDGSYARLKNASLSYQLPEKWIKGLHLGNARVLCSGQNLNLFNLTKYSGLDPETGGSALPPLRVITFGLQLGF